MKGKCEEKKNIINQFSNSAGGAFNEYSAYKHIKNIRKYKLFFKQETNNYSSQNLKRKVLTKNYSTSHFNKNTFEKITKYFYPQEENS